MQSSKNSPGASNWRKCTKWHLKVKIFTKYRAQYKESLQLFDNLYGDNENKSCNVYCCNWYLFGPFKGGGLNKFIEYNIV